LYKKTNISKTALVLISAFFLCFTSHAQLDSLELVEGVDKLILQGKRGRWLLQGNVVLKQNNDRMYCDSAYYYYKKKEVYAYGNVHLNKKDTLNLYCDSLFFNLKTDYAKLWGNVRLRDNEYRLTTDSMDFDAKKYMGVYKNGGLVTSIVSDECLKSRVGYFYPKSKDFFFRGDVVYTSNEYKVTTDTLKFNGRQKRAFFYGPTDIISKDATMYCERGWYDANKEEGVLMKNAAIFREKETVFADSLYYNSPQGLSIGEGNVTIRDTTQHIEFSGDYAKSSEQEHFAFITGNALVKRFEDKNDTLYIHADTLFNYMDSLNDSRLVLAYKRVKLFKKDMQGICDSLAYNRPEGLMTMYEQPVLWTDKAQLSGDTITAFEKNGKMSKATINNNALTITEVDSAKYYNQVYGRNMVTYFDSTSISKVDVLGNAKSIYFIEEEKENDTVVMVKQQGMNRIYSSDITLYFEKGNIKGVTYRDSPDGVMYPMDQIKKSEERVEQFKWDISRRPVSWRTMILPEE
jgi:lipopolysaccharide export system protein LptA